MDTDLEVRPKIAETVEIDPIVPDLRPKGRGRPQRILLGQWPEDHVREVIRAVVFREGELSSVSSHGPGHTASPPAPTSSPQNFPGTSSLEHQPPTKTEPQDPSSGGHGEAAGGHPLAAESRAAQAAFEAQMKQFYNNPFASQLLVASSKMFSNIDLNPFLQTSVKVEAPDEDTFEDAEAQEKARSEAERGQDRGQDRGQGSAPAIRGDQQVLQTLPGHPRREAQEEECGEGEEEGQEHQDWSSLSRHHSFSHELHVSLYNLQMNSTFTFQCYFVQCSSQHQTNSN